MKSLFTAVLLLLFTVGFSQNYTNDWDKVISLENEGKIKSAEKIVRNIYSKADNSKNETQLIKTFFYKSKYMLTLEEDAQQKIISNLQKQITKASIPSKALLNLVYARCLNSYLTKNNSIIRSRTYVDSMEFNLKTSSFNEFTHEIDKAYSETLKEENILRATAIKEYEQIFDFFQPEEFNKTSLYSYLLEANIEHYTTNANKWGIHNFQNEIYSNALLGANEEFKNTAFDSLKNNAILKVIRLYQMADYKNTATELELDRLLFSNEYILKNPERLLKSLSKLQKRTPDNYLLQRIQLEKAILVNGLASKENHPDYKIKAVSLLDSILTIDNKSNTFKKALQKKSEIVSRLLSVNMLKYTYDKENTRAFINYKNIDSIKISFYKTDYETAEDVILFDSIAKTFQQKHKSYTSKIYHLKNKKDYFDYTTEVPLPQLETGFYVVAIDDFDATDSKAETKYEALIVSNTVVLVNEKNNEWILQAVDRKTGKPLADCQLKTDFFDLKTDAKGIVKYKGDKEQKRQWYYEPLTVINQKDTLKVDLEYFNHYNDFDEEKEDGIIAKVNFYLDRAIYRPGQTVYYKGIATQTQKQKQKILPNFLLKVVVKNADLQKIKTLEVTTNEFGSFSGEFILPKNGLTGEYYITIEEPEDYENDALYDKVKDEHPIWDNGDFDSSRTEFRVEEYKRPKFEVTFNPVKETYLVNQTVKVTGNAKSFAGSSITDAKVVYRIDRNSFYNWKNRWNSGHETIVSSETKTDPSGNFNIEFKALPDEDYDQKSLPVFMYKITADITDSNGETHSATADVNVGYHSLDLDIEIPNIILAEKENQLQLKSTNLNGQFVAVDGEIKIYSISEFKNKFKKRKFSKPEIEGISDADFEKLFPYENNEKPIDENENGILVYSRKVNTDKDKTINLGFMSKFKSGNYKVVFSAVDKFNNPIQNSSPFELLQKKEAKLPNNSLLSIEQLNENPLKDGFIKIRINSAIPNLYASCTGIYNRAIFYENNVEINNNQQEITIPVNKIFNREFKIVLETVYDNHYFKEETNVYLKDETPATTIQIETFRSKLDPGKQENWSFKIKEDNKNTEAEVLVSMYDMSLDQFYSQDWKSIQNTANYPNNYYRGKNQLGFQNITLNLNHFHFRDNTPVFQNEHNRLMWFGFDFSDSKNPIVESLYKKQITKKAKKPSNAKIISGIVSDSTGPLPGSNITVKGTNRSAQADFDGYYEIEAAKGEILVISFVGMEDATIGVGENSNVNIKLQSNGNALHEVVVAGYGKTETKSRSVGAVMTVTSKTTTNIVGEEDDIYGSAGILLQTLQGQLAGTSIALGAGQATNVIIRGESSLNASNDPLYIIDGVPLTQAFFRNLKPEEVATVSVLKHAAATAIYGNRASNGVIVITTKKAAKEMQDLANVKTRSNRNETAFFYPQLLTDKEGRIKFGFTTPEELTQWKFRLFSHTKKMASGYMEKNVVTQKELMVFPNMPRFLREKDTIIISTKIANLTSELKKGVAVLQLFDATTMENIDLKMMNSAALKNFELKPSGNTAVSWKITIPEGLQAVQYKVVAKAGDYSDGEESILPVLTNTILVTESIPIWVRENSKKEYAFENLKNNTSATLRNHLLTLEYTSNPTWIAIQSLPYLMEYEHDCAEQTFSKYYSNVLATEIINSNPKIAAVFDNWSKNKVPLSKLNQNEELKSLVLAETPWLKETQTEEEKKLALATLFDMAQMKTAMDATFKKLKEKQKPSGGFAWFDGGNENSFITRHIVSGLGHLQKLKVADQTTKGFSEITKTAIPYLDNNYLESNKPEKNKRTKITTDTDLHYLYMRSFYLTEYPISSKVKSVSNTQLGIIKSEWLNYSLYKKGLAALILYRFGDKNSAKKVLENLKETAANNEDWGMYWIENKEGWYWHQAPIETQALLIEAFSEIANDTQSVNAMKVWLLKKKQTKNWPTTKATTEAIYALLLQGSDWLSVKDNTKIKIGDEKIMTAKLSANEKEAETGYLKLSWNKDEITKKMATVSIENNSKVPAYGGIYWQYFEDSDKIKKSDKSVMNVAKELYLKKNTDNGQQLERITSAKPMKVGDLVTVRLLIETREDMEFVHLKDMRASCFEPINVLSQYEWKDNLNYYISTKDASTHLFFDKINKGTYVVEYDLRVNNNGAFSNGITTIESMYAPEFTSHTKGIRVKIAE